MLAILIISFGLLNGYNNKTSSLQLGNTDKKFETKFVDSNSLFPHNNHLKASNRYTSYARNITISLPGDTENCNALISDVVSYRATNTTILEHMLLHNNFDKILNLKISSPEFKNISFKYNDKINVITLFFNGPSKVLNLATQTAIQTDHEFLLKKENQSFSRLDTSEPDEFIKFSVKYEFIAVNINKLEFTDSNTIKNNYVIWKIINQNSLILDETEVFFSYRVPLHVYNRVSSNINISPEGFKFSGIYQPIDEVSKIEVTTSKLDVVLKQNQTSTGNMFLINNKDLRNEPEDSELEREKFEHIDFAEYVWTGALTANKVQITKLSFPFQYTKCEPLRLNILMIGIGSLFVAFVIVMIYVVVTSLTLEKL